MKQCYIPKSFKKSTLELIFKIEQIVEEYQAAGYVLTVRQLYYQLVARDIIPNTLQSYKNTASIINDAKHAGMIDWDMIEDRTRAFERRASWKNGKDILEVVADQFHMDLWKDQDYRVFVIIEKEALVGVLDNVCKENDVPILAARGYPSGSVLREFAIKDMRPALRAGQRPVILHLGDHDPSGIDMTRDLEERMALYVGRPIQLQRLALNMQQIEEEQPPENPAKVTDSRFEGYAREYGTSSWELDALSPQYLSDLVQDAIDDFVDTDLRDDRQNEIEKVKERLLEVAEEFNED